MKSKQIRILNVSFGVGELYSLIILIVLTVICFSNSIMNEFAIAWDDDNYILFNPLLSDFSLNGIIKIFTSHWKGNYHPITTISNLFEYHLFGPIPGFYHLTNLLIHIMNVLLVFVLVFQLNSNKFIAFSVALLFGIHPMHVESVSWISERKDVLYAFFYLMGLISYNIYVEDVKQKKYVWFAFVLFIFAILSKSAAISFSVMLFVFDYFWNRKFSVKLFLEKIPFLLIAVTFGILAIYTQSAAGAIKNHLSFNLIDKIVLLLYSNTVYFYKLFVPVNLSILHIYPQKMDGYLPLYYYIGAFVPLIILCFLYLKRNTDLGKIAIFGFAFYLVSIAMVLQLIPLGSSYISERFTYIPYIGLFFVITSSIYPYFTENRIFSKGILKVIAIIFMCLYLFYLCSTTYHRNKVWKDSITLFSDVISKYPNAHYAYWNRGLVKYFNLDYKGAINDYTEAIRVNPEYADAYYARAYVKSFANDLQGAIDDYEMALNYKDTARNILLNIANAKYGLKNYTGAIQYYDRFLKKYPTDPEGHYGLSNCYWALGDTVKSMEYVDQTLKYDPEFKGARHVLGIYKFRNKDYKGAIEDLNIAIKQNPITEDFTIRGKAKFETGDITGALEDYYEAIRLDKNNAEAYLHRGKLQLSVNRQKEACKNWDKASKLGNAEAYELISKYCIENN